jgi:hypothetical protein
LPRSGQTPRGRQRIHRERRRLHALPLQRVTPRVSIAIIIPHIVSVS